MKSDIEIANFDSTLDNLRATGDEFNAFWLHSYDDSLTTFFRQKVKHSFHVEGWNLVAAKDLTTKWIEDNLAALTLFADDKPVAILDAFQIKKDVFELLLSSLEQTSKKIFLFSSGKSEPTRIKKFCSEFACSLINIKAPAFWDYDKVIQYVFSDLGFMVDGKTTQFLAMRLGQNFYELMNAARVCELNYPEKGHLDYAQVEELFKSNKHIDRFKLAGSFNEKKLSFFFYELLQADVEADELKSFFSFMISHCVKIVDPSYAQSKKKLSKYDKEVMGANKAWSTSQLDFMLEQFSKLVIMCKQKKELKPMLESLYLRFHSKGV